MPPPRILRIPVFLYSIILSFNPAIRSHHITAFVWTVYITFWTGFPISDTGLAAIQQAEGTQQSEGFALILCFACL